MLIVLEFPFCDVRRFVSGDNGRLNHPDWWLLEADQDFVRSIGMIRQRRQGGIKNWIGEYKLCVAKHALRFPDSPENRAFFHQPGWKIAFRTLYFDGCCVGKFEISVSFPASGGITTSPLKQTIRQFLDLPVRIPTGAQDEGAEVKLGDAGKHLARLFRRVSTNQKWADKSNAPEWWVTAGKPALLIEQRFDESVAVDLELGKSFQGREGAPACEHYSLMRQGRNLGVWAYHEDATDPGRQEARQLRIVLMRVHAEREALVNILRLAGDGRLDAGFSQAGGNCPDADLIDADIDDPSAQRNCKDLQAYLNAATRRIGRLEQRTGVPIEALANELDDAVNEGEREAIRAAIERVRPNVKRKVAALMDRGAPAGEAEKALTGTQKEELRDALVDAFNLDTLRTMVEFKLDTRLDVITADGPLPEVVANLIRWAERNGRVDALIRGAVAENPGNPQLQAFVAQYGNSGMA